MTRLCPLAFFARMPKVHIPFRSLTIWALVLMEDIARSAGSEPITPSADLRLALAWLASVRPDERSALHLFWIDAIKVIPSTNPHSRKYQRGLALVQRVGGIAERMLIGTELLGEMHRMWKQGLFDGAAESQSHAYLVERITAYRENEKRRAEILRMNVVQKGCAG